MKPLPLKIDNYLLERIEQEAHQKRVTKAEVVRSALIHYLLHREDLEEAILIKERLAEPDISESQVKVRLARHRAKHH